MNFWKIILHLSGWEVDITAPRRDRCVICVAPHTSNWDFLLGLAAYKSLGREANFLMKKFWFFFPLGILIRKLGGIPVDRSGKSGSLTERVIDLFGKQSYLNLAVTPEGTRSANAVWHTGFLRIAVGAGVPVQLGVIDYRNKKIVIKEEFQPSADIDKDMEFVKQYYSQWGFAARYPEKFKT